MLDHKYKYPGQKISVFCSSHFAFSSDSKKLFTEFFITIRTDIKSVRTICMLCKSLTLTFTLTSLFLTPRGLETKYSVLNTCSYFTNIMHFHFIKHNKIAKPTLTLDHKLMKKSVRDP